MTKARIITSKVPALTAPTPLGEYLSARFTYFTKDDWQAEIEAGRMALNGTAVADGGTLLHGGEVLAYDGSAIVEPAVDTDVKILYEDEWFVAVNKPGDLPVHPAGRYFNHTLTAILEERFGRKVFPAHRLDRETSGVLLLAFDGTTAGLLARSLAAGTKQYVALVHGEFPETGMTVDLPLGPDDASAVRKKRKAWPGGTESAVTRFEKILAAGDLSLVRCLPETGRLHQIRAHLAAAGFPIVGDKLYGTDERAFLAFIEDSLTPEMAERLILARSALHCARIVIAHPRTGETLDLRAGLPALFCECIRSHGGTCQTNELP